MINMDYSQRVVINTKDAPWLPSPMAGVWRKPLAREDAERGHATSIVRYEPGARFSSHDHPKGEEILVLEGTFSDETGDYAAGSYLRNPKGYRHAPFSIDGCVILVKLHQFADSDHRHLCIDTHRSVWLPGHGSLSVLPLHQHQDEQVALVRWPTGAQFQPHRHLGGEEIYVIEGELIDELGRYPAGTWIRSPDGSQHNPHAEQDTLIWVKTGHLLMRETGATRLKAKNATST